MRSGPLRHTIIIQQVAETRDATGGIVETWTPFASPRAQKVELTGREYFNAAQVNAEKTVKFRIRHMSGITEKMRVSFASNVYDIKAILPDERNREIILMCEV